MDPAEIEALLEQAFAALRCGDDVRALALSDQLVSALPEDPVVRALRAQVMLRSAEAEDALAEARRAVELDSQNAFAHLLLGLAAWRSQKLALAQESLERAIRLSRRSAKFLAEYAWFMAQERGPRLAEQAAREALAADPNASVAWAALGLAQYRLHRRGEAKESLGRALQLDPNDIYAQSAMVVLLQEQGEDQKAVALAHLLEDQPGAEDFVAAVRAEAKQRQLAKRLIERQILPEPLEREPSRRGALWVVIVAIVVGAACLVFCPYPPVTLMVCVIVALLLLWYVRYVFE